MLSELGGIASSRGGTPELGDEPQSSNTASWRASTPSSAESIVSLPKYRERSTDDILNIASKIMAVIDDARSPSHYFAGPYHEQTRLVYNHETASANRILSIRAPPFTFSATTNEDYLINLDSTDFFEAFDELHVTGSSAIVNGTIFYVRLPRDLTATMFMKRIDLSNIIITQELCNALATIATDELTLAGAVFSRLRLTCPPSLHVLTLGAVAECQFFDEITNTFKPWMTIDHTRCLHIQVIALNNGCTWKDGICFYCRIVDMYAFVSFIAHLPTLRLTMHAHELADNSYAFALSIATTINKIELARFIPGTSSFNVVPCANDMRQYPADRVIYASDIDTKSIVGKWYDRGIAFVQLDATFAALLPFSTSACWYRMFSAVEWEAPADHTIPVVFEDEYPLLFIPPSRTACTTYSVYIPATHKVDQASEIFIRSTPFATGSFVVFRSENTMCRAPDTSIRLLVAEQPDYLPVKPLVRGFNRAYVASFNPLNYWSSPPLKKI